MEVDLLDLVLADIADPHRAGVAIEGEAPRVAESQRPDLRASSSAPIPSSAREWIVLWDLVAPRTRNVETEDRGQERVGVLPVPFGITGTSTVPQTHIEVVVRTEGKVTSVVVGERLVHLQDHFRRIGIGLVGVVAHPVAHHGGVPVRIGVVDVEAPRLGVVGFEREAEESLLTTGNDPGAHVEERLWQQTALRDDPYDAALLDYEEPLTPVAGVGNQQRADESGDDLAQLDVGLQGIGVDL